MLPEGYLYEEDGELKDPEGRAYASVAEDAVAWYDSRGKRSQLRMPRESIESIERGSEPGAAIVTFSDGTECTFYGSSEDVRIQSAPPERTGGKITDLEHILDYVCGDGLDAFLWTDYHDGTKRIDLSMIGAPSEEIPIKDASVPVRRFVEAQTRILWGRPLNVTECDMTAYLEHRARLRIRNRFIEPIAAEARKPDLGSARRTGAYDLFQSVGLTAPAPEISAEEEEAYVRWTNRAVLMSAIKRQFEPSLVDICPVIIGPQGSGKTALCRFLGGKWYRASTQDVKNARQFMESVNGAVIAEFREGIQTLNPETLKEFLDWDKVQYRKPYDKTEKEYPIPFVTVITTNDPQPLLDLTGARRFLPLYMDPSRRIEPSWELTEADRLAVWSRALRDYENGEDWRDGWDEVKDTAAKMQDYASRDPPYFDQLMEVLSAWPNVGDKIPKRLIAEGLTARIGEGRKEVAMEGLRKNPLRFGLEKVKNPQYFEGKSERFYRRIQEL